MPFEIIRNDLTNMQVDAIVNSSNPRPIIGYGVDSAVHKKAGDQLLFARKQIGDIAFGDAAITPAFGLDAKYVIHAVSPVWQDGKRKEQQLLESCYEKSLQLALEYKCESIAFPLLAAGNLGFPKELALQVAINAFSKFLLKHEMQIYLVVFDRNAVVLSQQLFHSVKSYIDDTYIEKKSLEEYGISDSELYDEKLIHLREAMSFRRRAEVAFAIALELNLNETKDFIGKAGYALTHSSKFDIIIEYFLLEGNYNSFEINETLFAFGQPLIGA